MSHQTGIRANEALRKFFGTCHNGKIRVFKVSIENEELTLSSYKEAKGSWEEDYDGCVKPLVVLEQPSYIMYRFDKRNDMGDYSWLLILWSPDESPIREKMLYASTKATLKQEFGSAHIKEELHATSPEEVTLSGLKRWLLSSMNPAPLTAREEELGELNRHMASMNTGTEQGMGSVSLPIEDKALKAITFLTLPKQITYVRLRIDIPNEEIALDCARESVDVLRLPELVPEDAARYHLFKFRYEHEGKPHQAIMFIYSMPGYTCPIKERMLYSSCKAPLLKTIEYDVKLKIDKKLEIENGKELTHEFLYESIHPKMTLARARFEKPKGPPNRGAKRITKSQQ